MIFLHHRGDSEPNVCDSLTEGNRWSLMFITIGMLGIWGRWLRGGEAVLYLKLAGSILGQQLHCFLSKPSMHTCMWIRVFVYVCPVMMYRSHFLQHMENHVKIMLRYICAPAGELAACCAVCDCPVLFMCEQWCIWLAVCQGVCVCLDEAVWVRVGKRVYLCLPVCTVVFHSSTHSNKKLET